MWVHCPTGYICALDKKKITASEKGVSLTKFCTNSTSIMNYTYIQIGQCNVENSFSEKMSYLRRWSLHNMLLQEASLIVCLDCSNVDVLMSRVIVVIIS